MKANTIRLDHSLLKNIYPLLESGQSLASFVREVLQEEINRQRMRVAANRYNKLLSDNKAERKFLEDWENADLGAEVVLKNSARPNVRRGERSVRQKKTKNR